MAKKLQRKPIKGILKPPPKPKRPKGLDVSQLAKRIVDEATGNAERSPLDAKRPD